MRDFKAMGTITQITSCDHRAGQETIAFNFRPHRARAITNEQCPIFISGEKENREKKNQLWIVY
jgi:hypothetical protein